MRESFRLEGVGETLEAGFDGTVKEIVTHADAQATQQLGVSFKIKVKIIAILLAKRSLKGSGSRVIKSYSALDRDLLPSKLGPDETAKGLKHAAVVAGLLGRQFRDRKTQVLFVHLSVLGTETEDTAGSALGDFGNFHRRLREKVGLVLDAGKSFFADTLLIVIIESLTGDLGGGSDHEAAKLLLQLG